jgi:hypothetical protein
MCNAIAVSDEVSKSAISVVCIAFQYVVPFSIAKTFTSYDWGLAFTEATSLSHISTLDFKYSYMELKVLIFDAVDFCGL